MCGWGTPNGVLLPMMQKVCEMDQGFYVIFATDGCTNSSIFFKNMPHDRIKRTRTVPPRTS